MSERTKQRYVPSTVVIGPNGPMVTRGYTEIGGLRIYDDQLQIGAFGERVISRGGVSIARPRDWENQHDR